MLADVHATYNFPSLKERTRTVSFFIVRSSLQSGDMTLRLCFFLITQEGKTQGRENLKAGQPVSGQKKEVVKKHSSHGCGNSHCHTPKATKLRTLRN